MASMTHALAIYEIANQVRSFLTRKQLLTCILVSRRWHEAFSPFLWEKTLLKVAYVSMFPTSGAVQLHKNLVRYLSYPDFSAQNAVAYHQITFPNLVSFRSHFLPWTQWSNNERTFWEKKHPVEGFLERHSPNLQSLTLDSHFDELKDETDEDLEHSIWRVILVTRKSIDTPNSVSNDDHDCPRGFSFPLRSLTLNRVTFHWRELDACDGIWEVLKNLDSLTIQIWSHSKIQRSATTPTNHPFDQMAGSKIQHLTLQYCDGGDPTSWSEFELIRQCQQLRSLSWHNPKCEHESFLVSSMQAGRWPYLESLHLTLPALKDAQLASMIKSMARPLRELTVRGMGFAGAACDALLSNGEGGQWKRLESLKIPDAKRLAGSYVQRILCSFPKLTTLHAVILSDLDIWQYPEPWVCHRMRDFQVSLCFLLATPVPVGSVFLHAKEQRRTQMPDTTTPQRPVEMISDEDTICVFIDRLAKLTELETLSIGNRENIAKLDWRGRPINRFQTFQTLELAFGLDRLKTLKMLRRWDMGTTYMDMTMFEAKWMAKHWPDLDQVWGSKMTPNHDVSWELMSFFRRRGIKESWQFN